MISREDDIALRQAAFAFLDGLEARRGRRAVTRSDLSGFSFRGASFSLMPTQQGIRKPRDMETAVSFVTKFATSEHSRPYADEIGDDRFLRYKWRGTDPAHHENEGMRNTIIRGLPLIWFVGVTPQPEPEYLPVYPVWIIGEEPEFHQFVVSIDSAKPVIEEDLVLAEADPVRRYAETIALARLHQREFRERVLSAYECRCALCRLRHTELLDAAHIREEKDAGEPVVSNGIAMCKIHHAAYDRDIMGISPDYRIELRRDVLEESDGPTLRYTLQGLHGEAIWTPRSRRHKPDRDLLAERFDRFRAHGSFPG